MPGSRLTRSSAFSLHGNFTVDCPNGSWLIWDAFHECAEDSRDLASVALGLISIIFFMISSLPQYYSSYKTGNMDQALSLWFLLGWLGGDSCNLIGAFLSDQLPIQTYTAMYYVLADLVMIGMFTYYKMKHRHRHYEGLINIAVTFTILGSISLIPGGKVDSVWLDSPKVLRRSLLAVASPSANKIDTKNICGLAIGSISAVLYLSSRIPQILTNFKRKSTEGISCFLFVCVILGNATYGVSVLLMNPDRGQGEGSYILNHLPWLLGSLGTMSLDLVIITQFLQYRPKSSEERETLIDSGGM
ncbi:lysosomal amino acid transporter 1 homolog [Callorhinchus milii]|uniref:PQ-loop repeat-containing protein 2-like protein n=1 Tax=Callorhinchus milii TaxID=7868 RepID=V9L146_CALMI|nr:lysosomal amino acid transporter 1 homolog [Callorhinchus milii]|eukprot:gi/632977584/ref/XP_007905429.1/ PREDICTED: lysosomal amino acid transporter 1 homolog [Callorhinchus milii]